MIPTRRMGRVVKRTGRVVPGVLLDATARAAALQAEGRAARDAAYAEAGEIRRQAAHAGREAGYAAGREEGLAEVTAILVAARAEAENTRRQAKPTLVALARKMAEKIVGRAVALDPGVLGEIVAEALASARVRTGPVTLRLHPEDVTLLEREGGRWRGRLQAVDLRVVEDASVGRHGCVVETPVGRLDARLETQLAALERALVGADLG